jgi:hypothetical protein
LKGSSFRNSVSTSLRSFCSLTSNGGHSVHPVATSASTSVGMKLPFGDEPLCATRSASTNPGAGSCQSEKVRTGMLRRIASEGAVRRRSVTYVSGRSIDSRLRTVTGCVTGDRTARCARTRSDASIERNEVISHAAAGWRPNNERKPSKVYHSRIELRLRAPDLSRPPCGGAAHLGSRVTTPFWSPNPAIQVVGAPRP